MINLLQAAADSVFVIDDNSISALQVAINALIAAIAGLIGWFTGRKLKK